MTAWHYSINYGPDGEANYANVYAADGQFVGNLRTHHAIAICNAFAVCEKLAKPTLSSPASAPRLRRNTSSRRQAGVVRGTCRLEYPSAPGKTTMTESKPYAYAWRYAGEVAWHLSFEEPKAMVHHDLEYRELFLAPSPAGEVREAHWTVESLAQWLHDETEHQESYPHHHWPEHPDDDGNRDGGFVKIVPKHAQAYFRQMAARLLGIRPFSGAYFQALEAVSALSSPATPEPALEDNMACQGAAEIAAEQVSSTKHVSIPGWRPDPSWRWGIGAHLRKHSGSWWEGRVVGFYSTSQTPRGYAVQLPRFRNKGPVQIFPEAAFEEVK